MMLAIVCCATVIVSAVVITSVSLQFTPTTVTDPGEIELSQTSTPSGIMLGDNAVYRFSVNVPTALTGAVVSIHIAEVAIAHANVTAATISYNGSGAVPLTFGTDLGDVLTYSYTAGVQGIDADIPVIITILYATAGTFTVSATVSGSA